MSGFTDWYAQQPQLHGMARLPLRLAFEAGERHAHHLLRAPAEPVRLFFGLRDTPVALVPGEPLSSHAFVRQPGHAPLPARDVVMEMHAAVGLPTESLGLTPTQYAQLTSGMPVMVWRESDGRVADLQIDSLERSPTGMITRMAMRGQWREEPTHG